VSDLERAIRALGVDLPPEEMARAVAGAEDDRKAAARLRDWLATQQKG
jgi:hypothetical protein